jgi:hypothetical protein
MVQIVAAAGVTEQQLKEAITQPLALKGFTVLSVHAEPALRNGKSILLVRLRPPLLPWKLELEGLSTDEQRHAVQSTNIFYCADAAARAIRTPKLRLKNESVVVHTGFRQCVTKLFQRLCLGLGSHISLHN